jgi:hypothetical protein
MLMNKILINQLLRQLTFMLVYVLQIAIIYMNFSIVAYIYENITDSIQILYMLN